jgi:hypothetical protein
MKEILLKVYTIHDAHDFMHIVSKVVGLERMYNGNATTHSCFVGKPDEWKGTTGQIKD